MPVPANAKKPTDRQSKATEPADRFSFTHDGETYELKPTWDVLTPGWLRKNRRRDDIDAFFTMVEALAPDDDGVTLDVIDNMGRTEFRQLMTDFYEYMGEGSGN